MKNHRAVITKNEKGETEVEMMIDGDELLNYLVANAVEITACESAGNPAAILIVEKAKHYRECKQPECLTSLAKAIFVFRCSRVN